MFTVKRDEDVVDSVVVVVGGGGGGGRSSRKGSHFSDVCVCCVCFVLDVRVYACCTCIRAQLCVWRLSASFVDVALCALFEIALLLCLCSCKNRSALKRKEKSAYSLSIACFVTCHTALISCIPVLTLTHSRRTKGIKASGRHQDSPQQQRSRSTIEQRKNNQGKSKQCTRISFMHCLQMQPI